MLVNGDAKALEWAVGSWLANDKVAIEEIQNKVDAHTDNQRAFGLPSRLIAKKFLFRLIYGGSAYSYANDPDFVDTSTSEKFWQRAIDAFHHKYYGWSKWWVKLLQEATTKRRIVSPLGRAWDFSPKPNFRGEMKWPETTIKNYPVQGTSADLMCLTRVMFAKAFKAQQIEGKLLSTVHDSIVVDVVDKEVERTCQLFLDTFHAVPAELEKRFGVSYPLPFNVEVCYGKTLGDMKEYES